VRRFALQGVSQHALLRLPQHKHQVLFLQGFWGELEEADGTARRDLAVGNDSSPNRKRNRIPLETWCASAPTVNGHLQTRLGEPPSGRLFGVPVQRGYQRFLDLGVSPRSAGFLVKRILGCRESWCEIHGQFPGYCLSRLLHRNGWGQGCKDSQRKSQVKSFYNSPQKCSVI